MYLFYRSEAPENVITVPCDWSTFSDICIQTYIYIHMLFHHSSMFGHIKLHELK